ncbi:hypothetical protein SKAU_G00262150 [Synaphobranchus kaupii]|uniref:Coiled-coil domain containing 83 n=1 Tax=Synaphobranchus kaupii TaxID=118154 RepID=A0A9Q1IPQ7_SYNKA|nr:hypothetical protein SKAU_G00262150 [Synaphobranchus kaupii]
MPKKKQTDEEQLTLAESFITFQLQVKRKEVADLQEEVSLLEYKNQRYKDQRQQLKEEQLGHIKSLHKQLKDKEGKLAQEEVACRQEVEEALQENSQLIRTQELELAESIEWTMKEDMKKTDKKTERKMEKEKHLASERAIKHLDKHSRLAIKENKWLKKALSFYKLEVSRLEVAVQKLEEKNLAVLSKLFDLQFSDPSILSDIFTSQKDGPSVSDLEPPGETIGGQDIIGKLVEADWALGWPAFPERDEPSSSYGQPADQPTSSSTQEISDLLYGRQSNVQDCPHLGALKLLNMEGKRTLLHQVSSSWDMLPPGLQEITSDWPVTTSMILDKFK